MNRVEPLLVALQELFGAGAAERLGWTLLHSLWQGVAVAALLAVALVALRRQTARSRHAAALVALTLLTAIPVATFLFLPAPHRSEERATPTDRRRAMPVVTPTADPAELPPLAALPPPPPSPVTPHHARQYNLDNIRNILHPFLPALVFTWLLGVTVLSLWHLNGYLHVRRLRHVGTRPLDDAWRRRFEVLCRRLGVTRPVQLLESGFAEIPTVAGWLRPVILVPASAVTGLPAHDLEAIIAHELAHVRRHDYFVCVFQAVVETLLFYHPATWWISEQVRREREDCCDDEAAAAVGGPVPYGRALASLDELRPQAGAPHLALAATGSPLLRRIRRLLNAQPVPPSRAARRLGSLAAAVVAATLAFLPAAVTRLGAQAQTPVDPATGETKAETKADLFTLKGTVTDARTGKPIDKFHFVRAPADEGRRPSPWQGHTITHHDKGAFEIPLDRAWPRTRVRIDAEGYAPAVSDVIEKQPGVVKIDFKLEPSKGFSGVILTPDKQPAPGAHVTLATISNEVMVYGGKLVFGGQAGVLATAAYADADGAFTLAPEIDPGTIVATHPSGYAEVPAQEFRNGQQILLRPWGALKGNLDVPGAGRDDLGVVASSSRPDGDAPYITHRQLVRPDPDGTFRMDHFAPGVVSVGIHTGPHNGTPVVGTFATIEVPQGDTADLTLGGRGRPLTGRVTTGATPPGAVDISKVKLRLALEAPHIGFPGDDAMWKAYGDFLQGERGKAYSREFNPATDGTFRLDNVPQGRYQLIGPVHMTGRVEVAPMPAGASNEPQNLGDIPLSGVPPLKPGAPADPTATSELSVDDIAHIDLSMQGKVARRAVLRGELARLNLTLLPDHRSIVILKKDLAALEAEIEAAAKDFRAKWLTNTAGGGLLALPPGIDPDDLTTRSLLAERDQALAALAEASRKFGADHPTVRNLKQSLQTAELRLLEHAARAEARKQPKPGPDQYYVGGRVPRPGVYQLNGRRVNLLQAVVAAGFDPTKSGDHAIQLLRRKAGEDRESVTSLSIKDLLDHREKDLFLQADDLILVKPPPEKPGAAAPAKKTSAMVVTAGDNSLLEKAVQSLGAGFDVTIIKPAAYTREAAAGYDVVLFDRVAPEQLPAKGRFLFIGQCPSNARLKPADQKHPNEGSPPVAADISVTRWERDHPVLRGISLDKIYIAKAPRIVPGGATEVLAEADNDGRVPLIVLHREAGSTYLVVPFDLLQSNWPLKVSFPIFIHRAITYLSADNR